MRGWVAVAVVACLAAPSRVAWADDAGPIRVAVECESYGRTKACPAFLLGFVDANKVLLAAPRAAADVVLYVSATQVALEDRVHLRFVGRLPGAPQVIELDVAVDTRGTDDEQRAQLLPAFLRGVALYVGARHPASVTVTLAAPEAAAVAAPATTPWGVAIFLGGFGRFTGTGSDDYYLNLSGNAGVSVSRLERAHRIETFIEAYGGMSRSPPLVADDGTEISLDTQQWTLAAGAHGAYLLNRCYSVGGFARVFREDPKGQYRDGANLKLGVEWDRYPADDPRGNRLAVAYLLGYTVERYNIRNEIGERFAQYPSQQLSASGTIRKDKVAIGLSLSAGSEILHPTRRYHVSASPFVEWKLGDHVDVNASLSITRREFPAPDESEIDPSDFEQLSRLSYAGPLSMFGSINLTIHWDRTNGARNDRFTGI
jgi:hypothetical protein